MVRKFQFLSTCSMDFVTCTAGCVDGVRPTFPLGGLQVVIFCWGCNSQFYTKVRHVLFVQSAQILRQERFSRKNFSLVVAAHLPNVRAYVPSRRWTLVHLGVTQHEGEGDGPKEPRVVARKTGWCAHCEHKKTRFGPSNTYV